MRSYLRGKSELVLGASLQGQKSRMLGRSGRVRGMEGNWGD